MDKNCPRVNVSLLEEMVQNLPDAHNPFKIILTVVKTKGVTTSKD